MQKQILIGVASWLLALSTLVRADEWSWSTLSELPPTPGQTVQPGLAGAFAGVHRDCLIVAGGANFPDKRPWEGGKKAYHDTIYALEKSGDAYSWHAQKVTLPAQLAYGTTITTPHGLICIGGESPGADGAVAPSDRVFVLTWDPKTKTVGVSRKLIAEGDAPEEVVPLPALSVPTSNLSSVLFNDQLFVLGGKTPDGYNDKMWYVRLNRRIRAKGTNPANPIRLIWRSLPMFKHPERSHAMAVLQNDGVHDCIWVLSGRSKDRKGNWQMLTDLQKFNLQSRTWLRMSDVRLIGEEARCVMAGSAIADGFDGLLVFGGAPGQLFKQLEEDFPRELAAAAAAGDAQHGKDIALRKINVLSEHPGFSRDILRYSALADRWEQVGTFPEPLPVTTSLVKWGDEVLIVSGEIRPGVRSPVIWKGQRVE